MPSPLDASYGPPRLRVDEPPSPDSRFAAHEAESSARARPERVRAFRLLAEVERVAARATREGRLV